MELKEVMKELEAMANENTKKTLLRHGAQLPFFGVKVGDLKKIVKKTKTNHQLSLKLYQTGNSDAMYLAGLIGDPAKITKEELREWAHGAYWYMIADYTVAALAAESPYAIELGTEWIDSDHEMIQSAGWSTLNHLLSIAPNESIDLQLIEQLMDRVLHHIDSAKNRVKYAMNNFIIGCGSFLPSLHDKAIDYANKIGKVEVQMCGTACKVPFAPDYIEKVKSSGRIGKKRKAARC